MTKYKVETVAGISKIPQKIYENIWNLSPSKTPFTKWEFLVAMEITGCVGEKTGWVPRPLLVYDENSILCGIAPRFAKFHSYGEYVFDWAWANAIENSGKSYYPKWLIASPFSPIPGTKILSRDKESKINILNILIEETIVNKFSSVHLLFGDESELDIGKDIGWLRRYGVQFQWKNRSFTSFEDFLKNLSQKKRKKIKAERRKVSEANVRCKMIQGNEITDHHWDFFYECYERTYFEHGNAPYLNRDFFSFVAEKMPNHFAICIAEKIKEKKYIASSLFMLGEENNSTIAYGRYWGAIERVSCLHFEVSYYAPIEWAINRGIARIEGGAQGEHKLARGFEPNQTGSIHWIYDNRFKDAVAKFLIREGIGVENYLSELNERNPFQN